MHPQRHILTRALGVSSDVDADMWELRLRSGDRIVICSDGLSEMKLGLDELASELREAQDPTETAQRLVAAANERGGSDNITAVVIDVLVGEDGDSTASVVTPIGLGAGAPLLIAPAATAVVAAVGSAAAAAATAAGVAGAAEPSGDDTTAVPRVDSLAPGAKLAFAGRSSDLSSGAPQSGEFFRGATSAVPVARTTTRVPIAPRPAVAPPPGKESRRARRRRLGIPRRITIRVVLFVLLVAAVPTAAYYAIRWYAYDNWFLALQGKQIVIKRRAIPAVSCGSIRKWWTAPT